MPEERAGDVRATVGSRRSRGTPPVDAPASAASARAGAAVASTSSPRSDLDHDREDHRPALRLLVQVARHAVLDLALEQADLADVVARVLDRGS